MRNPLPVGGTYDAVTSHLTITFDERITVADPASGDLIIDGFGIFQRFNNVPSTIVGRRVTWPTGAAVLITGPPLRVTYIPTVGAIRGVGGGVVQAFANFPLTLV